MVCVSLRHRELLGQRRRRQGLRPETGQSGSASRSCTSADRLGGWTLHGAWQDQSYEGQPVRADAGTGLPMHGTLPRPWHVLGPARPLDHASDAFPFPHTTRIEAALDRDSAAHDHGRGA